jgi:hypothetical protein
MGGALATARLLHPVHKAIVERREDVGVFARKVLLGRRKPPRSLLAVLALAHRVLLLQSVFGGAQVVFFCRWRRRRLQLLRPVFIAGRYNGQRSDMGQTWTQKMHSDSRRCFCLLFRRLLLDFLWCVFSLQKPIATTLI